MTAEKSQRKNEWPRAEEIRVASCCEQIPFKVAKFEGKVDSLAVHSPKKYGKVTKYWFRYYSNIFSSGLGAKIVALGMVINDG